MTTKTFSCWQCIYFKPDNPLSSVQGRCVRFAPHALDYYGWDNLEIETPLTTKGDIYTFDTNDARLPVGTDGQRLTANSATATGLEWQTPEAVPDVPLTTKGDLLTRDATQNVRLAVGTDGQVLQANSAASEGVSWETPFTSPLTTKGDVMVNNGSDDTRLPVGTDGQMIVADSSEATGLKWIDRAAYVSFQGAYLGTNTGGAELTMGRNGATTLSNPEWGIAQQSGIYDNSEEYPFAVTPNSEIVAVSINLTKGAVFDSSVGTDPHVRIFFYDISGTIDTYRGVASVPVPQAKVGVSSDTSTADYHYELLPLSTPITPFSTGGFLGWRVDLTDTADNDVIYAVRNLTVKVWVRIPLSDILDSSLIATKSAISSIVEKAMIAAITAKETTEPEAAKALPAAAPVLLSISPAGTTPTSAGKWSIIYDAPNMWCGRYRKNNGDIPEIP